MVGLSDLSSRFCGFLYHETLEEHDRWRGDSVTRVCVARSIDIQVSPPRPAALLVFQLPAASTRYSLQP